MSKLYFYYGTMGCGKTLQALIRRYNYIKNDKNILFIKPELDTRDGKNILKSRIGIEAPISTFKPTANLLSLYKKELKEVTGVIIDEVNFLTIEQVEQLRMIVDNYKIPVFAYGLKSDFQSHLFPGSKRLFEIADYHYQLESNCYCGKPAIVNARYQDDKIEYEGPLIVIGGAEKYINLCYDCWQKGKIKNEKEKRRN